MLNYQMVIGKSSVFNRKLSPIQLNHLFLWVIFHSYVSLEESFGSAQKATKTTASFHSNFHPVLEIPRKVFPTSPDQTNVLNDWGPMVTTIPVEIHSCGNCRRQIPDIWCPFLPHLSGHLRVFFHFPWRAIPSYRKFMDPLGMP